MSLSQGFPSTFSGTQETNEVLHNLDNETKKIYNDINNIMSASGHRHTGNGSDGAKIDYSALENAPTVYLLNDLATSSVSLWSSQKTQNEITESKNEAITQATAEATDAAASYAESASDSADDAAGSANLASLAAQSIADVKFSTCALMRADLAHADGVSALVYSDRHVVGNRSYTITTNFVATSTVAFGGVTFTCVASGAVGNQFNLGASTAISATNLAAAINANAALNTLFTAIANTNVITITDSAFSGGNTPGTMVVTGTGAITNGTAVESTSNGIWIKQGASGTGSWKKSYYYLPVGINSISTNNIIDEAVTPNKTSFIKTTIGTNKFNKEAVTIGFYKQYNTGDIIVLSTYFYSDFIPVSSNASYYTNSGSAHICFYTELFGYISGWLSATNKTFTIPANAKYMIISAGTNALDSLYIVEGTTSSPYYPYSESRKILKEYLSIPDNVILVDKSGRGDYTTVMEAVAAAEDGDTIWVWPGAYTNEIIEAWGKTINLVGLDKYNTIISNALDEYATPPLEMGAGSVKNLTFVAYTGGNTSGSHAYAMHVEDDNLFGKPLWVDNCRFVATNGAPVGMGMRGGADVRFTQCEFYNPAYNAVGTSGYAFYFHDNVTVDYSGYIKIMLKDCIFESQHTSGVVMRIDSQGKDGTTVDMTYINNVLANKFYTTTYLSLHNISEIPNTDWNGLRGYKMNIKSFGNNASQLNYTA